MHPVEQNKTHGALAHMNIEISREDLNVVINALYMQTSDILIRSNRSKSAKRKAELLEWFERNRAVREILQKQLENGAGA